MVVMETWIGGERAKQITDRMPFDGAYHTETIGYAGGLWMLWNSDNVSNSQNKKLKKKAFVDVTINLNFILAICHVSNFHLRYNGID